MVLSYATFLLKPNSVLFAFKKETCICYTSLSFCQALNTFCFKSVAKLLRKTSVVNN